jgi:hypothetical protein
MPTNEEILHELRTQPSTTVPNTGKILAGISANAAYAAARNGELGVPTYWVGGKLRVPSIAVLRLLGLEKDAPPADAGQQAVEPPLKPPPKINNPAPAQISKVTRPRRQSPAKSRASPRAAAREPENAEV